VFHIYLTYIEDARSNTNQIPADVSILSLSVTALFSLKSFFVYTGAAVTAVAKHEQTTSRYALSCLQTTLPLTMKMTS
jgi:hypothetical protein